MKNPTISIGMPVFNGAPYVETAIRTLLSQSYKNFELIIGDNCSTDSTSAIIHKYASQDNRIKYFRHKRNEGGLYNFEFVNKKATGEYFMWAAHDDSWKKNHLDLSIKALVSDPSVGFVFPTFKLESINLRISKAIDKNVFKFIESVDPSTRVLGYSNLHHSSHKCNLVYSLFRKQFLDDIYKIQNIENDGILSTLILQAAKGKVLDDYTFRKRYKYYWPGFMLSQIYLIKRFLKINIQQDEFNAIAKQGADDLILKFPQYEHELRKIHASYLIDRCQKNYKIID